MPESYKITFSRRNRIEREIISTQVNTSHHLFPYKLEHTTLAALQTQLGIVNIRITHVQAQCTAVFSFQERKTPTLIFLFPIFPLFLLIPARIRGITEKSQFHL